MEPKTADTKHRIKPVAQDLLRLGFKYFQRKDFTEAGKLFRMALDSDPGPKTRYTIGLAYARTGRMDVAAKVFTDIRTEDTQAERMARRLERFILCEKMDPLVEGFLVPSSDFSADANRLLYPFGEYGRREAFSKAAKRLMRRFDFINCTLARAAHVSTGTTQSFLNATHYQLSIETRKKIYAVLKRAGASDRDIAELDRMYEGLSRSGFTEQRAEYQKRKADKHKSELDSLREMKAAIKAILSRLHVDENSLSEKAGYCQQYMVGVYRGYSIKGKWKEPIFRALIDLGASKEEMAGLEAIYRKGHPVLKGQDGEK